MTKAGLTAILAVLAASLLHAQSDGITVTATKTVDLLPEEATFSLAVLAEPSAGLDDVLQALKDTGLGAKDLTGISSVQYGPGPNQTRLSFQFNLTVPYLKFRDTLDKLAAARRSLLAGDGESDLQTYFISVAATDAAREQARQRSIADLMADARSKGQSLAAAAGLSLGAVQGVADSSAAGGTIAVPGPFFGPPSALKTTFLLTVRFAVK